VNALTASFDSSGSSDPDGSIVGYAWDFGDGATSSQASPSHTYGTDGTYTVHLTVTDDAGAQTSVSHDVTVALHPPVAVDSFERSVSSGWGSAATGGAWTKGTGSLTSYSVDGHQGLMAISAVGATVSQYLNSVSEQNLSGTVDWSFSTAPTGGGVYAWVAVRHTASGEYRVKLRLQPSSTTLSVSKVVSGTETTVSSVTVAGLVYNAGDTLRMRFDVNGSGSTGLTAKVWKVGTSEPASWQLSTSDGTAALQVPGTFGLTGYLSGVSGTSAPITVQVDNLNVTRD
jgi:PKD repeat protein